MTLKVKTESLRGYGKMMRDVNERGTYHIGTYVAKHDIDQFNTGLLSTYSYTHGDTRDKVKGLAKKVGDLLDKSASELSDAAHLYEEVELENVRELKRTVWSPKQLWQQLRDADDSLGKVTRPPVEHLPHDATPYLLDAYPAEKLTEPQSVVHDDPTKKITQILDLGSPAHLINMAVKKLTGFDLVKECSEFFAGDWTAWSKCADVWRRCGQTFAAIADNIWKGNVHLDVDWQGNAADGCYAYHHKLAFAIKDLRKPLDMLGETYRLAAVHANTAASVVGDLIKTLADMGIVALLSKVGGPLSTLVDAAIVKRVYDVISNIQSVFMGARAFAGGLAGTAGKAVALLTDLDGKLPAPYHNGVRGR